MSKFRYHRMASNDQCWQRPHSGRLGVTHGDYVSETGFGHEDWNFARDIWEDGLLHLYLRQAPAKTARDEPINIVLAEHTEGQHRVLGFAERVVCAVSSLPTAVLERRVNELMELSKTSQLGGGYEGISQREVRDKLKDDEQYYWAAVKPADLIVLDSPEVLPEGLFKPPSAQYRLFKIEPDEYEAIKEYAFDRFRSHVGQVDSDMPDEDDGHEEGKRIRRIHNARERSSLLPKEAKKRFIENNGGLFCEACELEPATHYGVEAFSGRIIEAHHDVPLSSYYKPQKTKLEDLKMLCPTCHRAIHISGKSVEEFKRLIGR